METRKYGNTDMNVSVLGFGGAEIGFQRASQAEVDRLLGSALDAGLNVIDTAECYMDSEEKIGKAVSHRRDDFYLFTKCGHASGFDAPDWDVHMLEKSIDRSLKRLNVDHVDLIHLHSCSLDILRQGDVIDVLKRAKEAGKTRYIGYSGDSQAAHYAATCGAFNSLEISINIADQEAIDLTLPIAREKGMGVVVKRPIANAAWRSKERPENTYHHVYWDRLQELRYDFLQKELQEVVAVALRFTLSLPGVHTAIVGTANPARWRQNAELLEQGVLPSEQIDAIRRRWKDVANQNWVGQE